jgi:hypothetical protein
MHDAVRVRRVECERRVAEPLERVALRDGAAPQPVLERAAGQVLHDDERPLGVLADVEDRHRVRLAGEARGGERLAREARAQRSVPCEALGEDLDRDVAPERLVGRPVDLAHPALGDALG